MNVIMSIETTKNIHVYVIYYFEEMAIQEQ